MQINVYYFYNMELQHIVEQLKWRAAIKQFDTTKKVSEGDFELLLEVLRLSPSSLGLQPWKFIVVENSALRERISEIGYGQSQFLTASHLLVLCSRTDLSDEYINSYLDSVFRIRNVDPSTLVGYHKMIVGSIEEKGTSGIVQWNTNQLYIALGVFLTACAIGQIDACPMEGFDTLKCDEILGLTDGQYHSRVICAVGYRAPEDQISKIKKVRFAKEEIIVKM